MKEIDGYKLLYAAMIEQTIFDCCKSERFAKYNEDLIKSKKYHDIANWIGIDYDDEKIIGECKKIREQKMEEIKIEQTRKILKELEQGKTIDELKQKYLKKVKRFNYEKYKSNNGTGVKNPSHKNGKIALYWFKDEWCDIKYE